MPAFREAVTSKGKGASATRTQEETPEGTGPEAVDEEPPAVEEKRERKQKRKGKKKRAD